MISRSDLLQLFLQEHLALSPARGSKAGLPLMETASGWKQPDVKKLNEIQGDTPGKTPSSKWVC